MTYATLCAKSSDRGSPFTLTSPVSWPPVGTLPDRTFNKLVLPLPVGPISAMTWCGNAAPVSPLSTCLAGFLAPFGYTVYLSSCHVRVTSFFPGPEAGDEDEVASPTLPTALFIPADMSREPREVEATSASHILAASAASAVVSPSLRASAPAEAAADGLGGKVAAAGDTSMENIFSTIRSVSRV